MKKNIKIAIFSFLALGLITATAVSAYEGPNNENRGSLNKANNFNYEDRIQRMEEFHKNIDEETKNKITQMHKLMANGEFEEALKIKGDLDIGQNKRKEMRQGMGQKHENRANGTMPNFIDENNNGLCDHMEDTEIN